MVRVLPSSAAGGACGASEGGDQRLADPEHRVEVVGPTGVPVETECLRSSSVRGDDLEIGGSAGVDFDLAVGVDRGALAAGQTVDLGEQRADVVVDADLVGAVRCTLDESQGVSSIGAVDLQRIANLEAVGQMSIGTLRIRTELRRARQAPRQRYHHHRYVYPGSWSGRSR